MTTVILPWRGGDPDRERALGYVLGRYRAERPAWTVVVAECAGDWSKARAVMPAVAAAPADVVIVADADVWTDGLTQAIRAVVCGAADWAVPHYAVRRLTAEATAALIADPRFALERASLVEPTYQGIAGGGIVVAHRDTLLDVPLDPRFVGWGQEDESWGCALAALAGEPWRGRADLVHLFHEPASRSSRRVGSREGYTLRRRYHRARNNPAAVRAIIAECSPTY